MPHPPHGRPRPPPTHAAAFVDGSRLSAALEPMIPDPHDREFVLRCLLAEGPAHHRGANFALLTLLLEVIAAAEGTIAPAAEPLPVSMRLPPHLAREEAAVYPVALDLAPLRRIAADDELAAMVGSLTDGPPQHALANVLTVNLVGILLARLGRT